MKLLSVPVHADTHSPPVHPHESTTNLYSTSSTPSEHPSNTPQQQHQQQQQQQQQQSLPRQQSPHPSSRQQQQQPQPQSASSASQQATAAKSKSGSLAEDIQEIQSAMQGASSTAREKTLKILERLTARVALAETERDTAMSKFGLLQEEKP